MATPISIDGNSLYERLTLLHSNRASTTTTANASSNDSTSTAVGRPQASIDAPPDSVPSTDDVPSADSDPLIPHQARLDLIDSRVFASWNQFTMLVNAGHLGFAQRVATYADENLPKDGEFEFNHDPLDYETNYVFVISSSSRKQLRFDKYQIQCDTPLLLTYRKKQVPKLASHFGVVYLPHKSTASFVAGIQLSLIRIAKSWEGFDRILVQQGLSLTMGVPIASSSCFRRCRRTDK